MATGRAQDAGRRPPEGLLDSWGQDATLGVMLGRGPAPTGPAEAGAATQWRSRVIHLGFKPTSVSPGSGETAVTSPPVRPPALGSDWLTSAGGRC